jgi:hypothetical protein
MQWGYRIKLVKLCKTKPTHTYQFCLAYIIFEPFELVVTLRKANVKLNDC